MPNSRIDKLPRCHLERQHLDRVGCIYSALPTPPQVPQVRAEGRSEPQGNNMPGGTRQRPLQCQQQEEPASRLATRGPEAIRCSSRRRHTCSTTASITMKALIVSTTWPEANG